MKTLNFKVDPERVTVDDLVALEEGKMSGYRDLLARALTDEAGEFVPFKQAQKTIGGLTLKQLSEAADAFKAAMGDALPRIGGGK